MAKKSFKNEDISPVYGKIMGSNVEIHADPDHMADYDPEAHPELYAQKTPDTQEVQKAQEEQRTQGKKGAKMQRINMAFTPSNLQFIRTMSKAKGQTMTQFVNEIITRERTENGDAYQQIADILSNL